MSLGDSLSLIFFMLNASWSQGGYCASGHYIRLPGQKKSEGGDAGERPQLALPIAIFIRTGREVLSQNAFQQMSASISLTRMEPQSQHAWEAWEIKYYIF